MLARGRAVLRALALAGAGALLGVPALAGGSFGLSPMRVELSAAAPTAVLTLSNQGDAPVTLQIQARAWTQVDGQDRQAPSSDLILNPASATVPPGGEQIVRVALRKAPDRERERAYRLLVRELPAATPEAAPGTLGLRVALAMDIPMFVAPLLSEAAMPPALSLQSAAEGPPRLLLANPGRRHLRLSELRVMQGDRLLAEQGVFVVLAGATRALPLAPLERGPVRFSAQSNAGALQQTLESAPR